MFKNKYNLIGSLAIILAALLWSIDGLFIRPSLYSLSATTVVFWEHFLGFIILSPFIILNWQKIKGLSKKSWQAIAWVGLFGGVIGTIMITKAFFAAIDGQVTFATVIIIQKLQPVFAVLLARVVLREKLSKQFYFWAVLAILASYVLAFGKNGLQFQNIDWFHNAAFFALIAAFAFGSSTVFGKRIANHLDFKAVTALRFAITSLLMLIVVFFSGGFGSLLGINTHSWLLLALIVFSSGAGAMFIYYFGLKRVSASTTTILELFWPFSALVLDYFFNHNYLNITQGVAFLVLLFAFFRVSALGKLRIKFKAKVIHGEGKGKSLGYPTANLDETDLDIPHGVYLVKVKIADQKYSALMHFGFKEVFKEKVSLEIYIKDFSGDLYEQELNVQVIKKIREVKKFKTPQLLQEAIQKDLLAR